MSYGESFTKNIDFKRRVHFEANKHLDILTILQQMETNGFVDKIYDLINTIYEEEHHFTINELRKIAKRAKSNNEAFDFMDHYGSNNAIFKKNLVAILEIFVDIVWNSKLEKVYKEYQEEDNINENVSSKQMASSNL